MMIILICQSYELKVIITKYYLKILSVLILGYYAWEFQDLAIFSCLGYLLFAVGGQSNVSGKSGTALPGFNFNVYSNQPLLAFDAMQAPSSQAPTPVTSATSFLGAPHRLQVMC